MMPGTLLHAPGSRLKTCCNRCSSSSSVMCSSWLATLCSSNVKLK
jgi:hypothetical protein